MWQRYVHNTSLSQLSNSCSYSLYPVNCVPSPTDQRNERCDLPFKNDLEKKKVEEEEKEDKDSDYIAHYSSMFWNVLCRMYFFWLMKVFLAINLVFWLCSKHLSMYITWFFILLVTLIVIKLSLFKVAVILL